ncbi:hypothetical protein E2605_02565 [Dysgonomonas capnocytophagoides]|uniref:Uncharacterized protein n=1 Tax=Dysgonomonas capnocytophagoides TaxID=45254 RepID=A0A4Y8LD65_9BACT|nr:hypothetical protein [Dysgonomonas capnocytophagoides]TFD98990.1 hypothetical protein E2605_02565 [Dysgonomonas capnocytophagoides]
MNTIKYFSGILFALVLMMLPQVSFATEDAGVPAKIWTYPVVYALDQEVTWYFDMTGTNFSEGQDLYLWAWSPSEPDAGNFDNSSEFAKLEYVGDMVWKKTLTPTKYFNTTVANIESSAGFWMRLKGKGNEKQSDVIQAPWSVGDIKTFKESGNAVQIYPEKFYIDQPLSLLVNANLVWTGAVQGGLAGEEIHLHSGLNNFAEGAIVEYQAWIPEVSAKTKLTPIGDNIYKIDFIPREYFGVDEDFVMENIEFLFPAKDWAKVGTAEGGKNFVVLAPGVVAPPDPVFYFFPQKFTQYDILTLVRKNNEKKSQGLIYTIVAGGKTITGEFTGKAEEMRAYVNLLQGLAGATNLDKINLEVKDKNGSEILKTDIPLVPLSDLE